jgi:hypothetical protein
MISDSPANHRQSRILTPLATSVSNPEEQSMSSGDESDNVDLTDVETSDSDWSDTGELTCRYRVDHRSVTFTL